ncbi:hypothetical protein DRO66_02955 [Candidatus Bathyarchaeota archaeon]|nr:MAG: hypothetical protein DRO66_02955 [Candidatus Bathyarchaeota archaeon]
MSYAFTPGLSVTKSTMIRKKRILPIPGDVHVKVGDTVVAEKIVAQTFVPNDIHMRPISYIVGCEPYELPKIMKFKQGDFIKEGDLMAETKSFFGLFHTEHYSKYTGTIELISTVTGMVAVREPPISVHLTSYIPGKIIEVTENLGVTIETHAAYIQGIFGIGGEQQGELMTIAEPDEVLTLDHITKECAGKILVGGSLVTADILRKASDFGVKGIVVGGLRRDDLNKYLGYEIGVAITGQEDINLTCIVTEGFGQMRMAGHIYTLLNSHNGKPASINGATQIRAGVIRPEIIIPLQDTKTTSEDETLTYGMVIGTRVRIIRQPYFGALGSVAELPIELQVVETESHVRVLKVKLEDGSLVTVPRANVEIME